MLQALNRTRWSRTARQAPGRQPIRDYRQGCSAIAVATSIALMHMTKTLHPPGGATALIAVIGGDKIHNLGYLYVLIPVGCGAVIMLIIALLVNNIPSSRRYPEF